MSRTVGPSVMKAMMRIAPPQWGHIEREDFVDAGEQPRPGIAGGTTLRRVGGGFRVGGGCDRRSRRCQREGSDCSAQGRVGRQHAEVAVEVDARRQHQRRMAVEQLQRRQAQRTVPARSRFGARVEQALGIELAQPAQGEGVAGAVAQQTLAPGTVGGRDAHRAVDGEAAAMLPLRHVVHGIARHQAAAHDKLGFGSSMARPRGQPIQWRLEGVQW